MKKKELKVIEDIYVTVYEFSKTEAYDEMAYVDFKNKYKSWNHAILFILEDLIYNLREYHISETTMMGDIARNLYLTVTPDFIPTIDIISKDSDFLYYEIAKMSKTDTLIYFLASFINKDASFENVKSVLKEINNG